jgi:protein SCO1/2
MDRTPLHRRTFLLAGAGAGAAVIASTLPALADPTRPLHQDGADWFTNVEVTGHDGRTYRFFEDLLRDKIVMINFFYTDCDELCPLATQNLTVVRDLLNARTGAPVFMYSISLRPARDTPERLAAYARTYGVGPGWLMLTGKPDDIELLRHRLGFVDSDPLQDADPEQHLGTVRIANEPMHRWIMTPALVNPAAIVRSVKRVIPEPV